MESSKNKKTGRVLGLVIDKSRARLVWSNADAPFRVHVYGKDTTFTETVNNKTTTRTFNSV